MVAKAKRDDRGDSLIELLVAVSVMATAVVALLGALATAIRVSEFHRHQSEAGAFVKAFAEDERPRDERFFRIINEIPTVLLIVIVIMAVVKPL